MRPVHDYVGVKEAREPDDDGHHELKSSHELVLVEFVRQGVGPTLHKHISGVVEEADEKKHAREGATVLSDSIVECFFDRFRTYVG